ncbi:MAG TPA: FG-GAP-like repeat-containing protein [Opitutaceae bacterium]|jgi:hypothetical protein
MLAAPRALRWPVLSVWIASACLAAEITSTPLAPYPAPAGSTLFTVLPPEQTGVKAGNPYDDPRMWGDLYQESENGSLGTGVAIGDYDGDGRPDIFIVTKTGSCRLYRNLGRYRFEDVTEKAGLLQTGDEARIWKQGATFVDFNHSGRLSIYVCRFNAPNLLYVNRGDGTFKEMAHAYGLDVVDASVMASFCDYDRDGRLDCYIATNLLDSLHHPHGQRGRLMHQNRDGTFSDVTAAAGLSGESQSHSAAWWDFDNDGWPDLYVANDYGVPDKLYRNRRDGTFENVIDRALRHTSFYSMGSDTGDVDNDGSIDLFVADMAATTHRKDQHSVAEARESDRDADDPLIVPKYHRSALHLNTGTGLALEGSYLAGIAASDWTWSVRLEDLDNDGRLDLFVTNGFNRDPNPDEHQRSMDAESTADRIRNLYNSPVLNEAHMAFRNQGNLQFEDVSKAWGLNQKGVAFGAAFGDLSGDGNLDLVYSNYDAGPTVLRNGNSTGHRIEIDLSGTASNASGIGSVVRIETSSGRQVRQLWLARGYLSSSEPMLHFGLGPDPIVKRLTVDWPSGRHQEFSDLAADRRYRITEPAVAGGADPGRHDASLGEDGSKAGLPGPATPATAQAWPQTFEEVSTSLGLRLQSREEAVDELSNQPLLPRRLNRLGPALAVGNVFGNGHDDVVVGGTTADSLRLLAAPGAGAYRVVPGGPATGDAVNDGPVLLFDAQGRGTADLLVTKGGNSYLDGSPEYRARLFFNDGAGHFEPAPAGVLPDLPLSVGAAAAADFTHNGRLGLFLGGRVVPGSYPLPARSVLLVNQGGRFVDVTDQMAPALKALGLVTSALWTDVDGDGWPDLLITLEWGSVHYFHNDHGRRLEDWSGRAGFSGAGTGWWNSIAAADFNGDGRLDYVVGNVGLNTPYHADSAHPALLFSGDFNGDGGSELLEGDCEGGLIYPGRSRRTLGASIPGILRRYPRNDDFAGATLADLVGADALNAARRFAATEFRSGVFLSQPDGTYRFEPLPRLAQISPLQGVVAGDFLGNGQADIYAVQNSYAPVPSVGRFDSGLSTFLAGDGHGHFRVVPPAETGLLVPRDAKALAVLDLDGDGWPDFLVTRNNDTTLAFRNRGRPDAQGLRIVLHGPAGNPTGVGARITVKFSDGTAELAELAAGSGYYSQSAPGAFFPHAAERRPVRCEVRWPSGATTTQPLGGDQAMVTIDSP